MTTVVHGDTPGSFPFEPDDDGYDSSDRVYRRSRGRFEVVSKVIVDVGFGGFFSVCNDYNECWFI